MLLIYLKVTSKKVRQNRLFITTTVKKPLSLQNVTALLQIGKCIKSGSVSMQNGIGIKKLKNHYKIVLNIGLTKTNLL